MGAVSGPLLKEHEASAHIGVWTLRDGEMVLSFSAPLVLTADDARLLFDAESVGLLPTLGRDELVLLGRGQEIKLAFEAIQ